MRLLFVTKRRYTAKDLLDERYGRLFEIPRHLVARGHTVRGMLLSYNGRAHGPQDHGGTEWTSHALGSGAGLLRFARNLRNNVRDFRPDVVVASGDTFYVPLAVAAAYGHGVPVIADLYDNFESFASARLPLFVPSFRAALRRCTAVTCVSDPLAEHVRKTVRPGTSPVVVGNGVDTDAFAPMDRENCRRALDLPGDAVLVGTGGALSRNRGIETLYDAFERLRKCGRNVRLVVAGPRDVDVPLSDDVIDLGVLRHDRMSTFINALDIAVVMNAPTNFGKFCFPQKAQEILACRRPTVAADVGAMRDVFHADGDLLFAPGDSADLAGRIDTLIETRRIPASQPDTWRDVTDRFEDVLRNALETENTSPAKTSMGKAKSTTPP